MPRLLAKVGVRISLTLVLLSGCASSTVPAVTHQTVTLHILDHDSERGIPEVDIIRERIGGGDVVSNFLDPESRTIAQTDASGVAIIHRADIDQHHQIRVEDLRHVAYIVSLQGNQLVVLESQPHPPTADMAEMVGSGPLEPQFEPVDHIPISDPNTQVTISMRTSSVLEEFFLAGILQAFGPEKLARLSDAEFEEQLPGIVDSLASKYNTVRRERIETIVRDARHRAQAAPRISTTGPAE
jgi:hypothetical protein